MALVVIKKLAIASAVTIGGGFSGAIVYGSNDEKSRDFFAAHLPGYNQGTRLYQNFLEYVHRISRKSSDGTPGKQLEELIKERELLLTTMSTMAAQLESRNIEQLKELKDKYSSELEIWRRKYEKEQEENFIKELARQEEIDNAILSYKMEQEIKYTDEMNRLLQVEREVHMRQNDELSNNLHEIQRSTEEILARYQDALKSKGTIELFSLLDLACGHGKLHDVPLISACLEELKERTLDEFTRAVCKALFMSMNKTSVNNIDLSQLKREFYELKGLASDYSTVHTTSFGYLFPSLREGIRMFRHIFSGPSEEQMSINSYLNQISAAVQLDDLNKALIIANSMTGWPRVILKSWIEQVRTFVEINQGLDILRANTVAMRLKTCTQKLM